MRKSGYHLVKHFFYHLLEEPDSSARAVFNLAMMVVVAASITAMVLEVDPSLTQEEITFFTKLEDIFITIFITEYLLRIWVCSDFGETFSTARRRYIRRNHNPNPFKTLWHALGRALLPKLAWMVQPLAIVDLLAILPVFRIFRLFRVLRVLRVLKLFRYSRRLSFFGSIVRERSYEIFSLITVAVVVWGMVAVAFFVVERGINPKITTIWEAVYWSIITITTVGYGDITPATPTGQTIAVIGTLFGMWVVVFMTSIVVSALTERLVSLTEIRMESQIDRLQDHVIVVGLEALGRAVCRTLAEEKKPFVGIDLDENKVDQARKKGWITLQGNVTEDEDLWLRAGLHRAQGVIISTENEVESVYIILLVRDIRPDCFIVACGVSATSETRLMRVGANRVISPSQIGGAQMANTVLRPSVIQFFDMAFKSDNDEVEMQEMPIPQDSRLDGAKLEALYSCTEFDDVIVAGYMASQTQDIRFNPKGDVLLHAGDVLICFGHLDDLARFRNALKSFAFPARIGL
ncbi:MAG: NAD-binding protein [Magnetococcales bacterium]|nr:NAD-binding protein [Magnetococcales bacterium]